VRVEVCRALKQWEMMAEVSNHLRKIEPDEVGHALDQAHATRRFKSEAEAAEILSMALRRYYDDAFGALQLGLLLVRHGARRGGQRDAGDGLQEGREPAGVAETDEDLVGLR
jgi:hypothetical protein